MNTDYAQIIADTLARMTGEETKVTAHPFLPEPAVVLGDTDLHAGSGPYVLITQSEDDDSPDAPRELYVGRYEGGESSDGFVTTCSPAELPAVVRAVWGGAFV